MTDKPTTTDVVKVLQGKGELAMVDPEAASLAIVQRILQAATPEEVLTVAGTISADDILDTPFVLTGCTFMKSSFEDGPGVFGVLAAANPDTGESMVITCGGRNVVTQIARLVQLDALPRTVKMIRNERPTSNGYYPLWLAAA